MLLIHLRKSTWWALDEIVELFYGEDAKSKRSAVSKNFVAEGTSKLAEEEKEKAKKFKEYSSEFLYLDVTSLPKINGVIRYLYVVIGRPH